MILPFRFCQFSDSEVLVVNDAGEYLFLKPEVFEDFISYKLSHASASFLDLKGKHLLTDTALTPVIDLLATKYRTKRAFLSKFTALFTWLL